jgi:hypothetical protein
MPYKDPIKLKEAQHRWYLEHKTLTYARAREWKKKKRDERNRKRAREYYYKNRDKVIAKYWENKKMLVEAATITPGYVTARMQALIKEFGEQDAYWYENIRLGVLKGISVTILPQHEQDKFWHILKKRAKDIGDEIYAPNRKGWKEKEETYDNEPTDDTVHTDSGDTIEPLCMQQEERVLLGSGSE